MSGYSKLNVHELEGAGPGGAFRFVRRELTLRSHDDALSGHRPSGKTLLAVGAPPGAYEPRGPF